jgi:Flp pilus assembly protein TadD
VLQRTAGEFPDNPLVLRALVNQSHAQENEAGRAEAIQELARVIELGAGTPDDYFKLGGLLAVSDLVTQAIPMVEKAVQLNPYDKEFYPLLVLCYFSLHQDATARLTIRQWLKLFPEDQAKAAAVEKDAATDYPAQ